MSSPWKKEPDAVVSTVLKRAEISKLARRLQNRLALAKFKTKHGWEDLTLDTIEPKYEEEMRRKKLSDDVLSDSSSSASDLPYASGTLMSSPLKAPIFSDAIGLSSGSAGLRKRTFTAAFDNTCSSPSKRYRALLSTQKSFTAGHSAWKHHHHLAQSSPIKPRRLEHFTTSTGPDVSFFPGTRRVDNYISPNYTAAQSDDDDDLLPAHAFHQIRSSPPSTPPLSSRLASQRRSLYHNDKESRGARDKTPVPSGEEGADLLLFLAASPSPAVQVATRATRMVPPSTPPPHSKAVLPSSMMTTTPGGGNPFPNTPNPGFDFSDFVYGMTPSPAQKAFKTPLALSGGRTPLNLARRRLTFDDLP